MKWAYGVTTVPERQFNYLPKTLAALKRGGFNNPILFVDGPSGDYTDLKLEVVHRSSKIMAYGNWLLALLELWIRNPFADRYAIFQDDFSCYRNLRQYLDYYPLKPSNYWNLYTFPQNEDLNKTKSIGWYESNQRGRGAVALVFPPDLVRIILTQPEMILHVQDKRIPHKNIDGTLVNAINPLGIKELVHYPSLVSHIGDSSAAGNPQFNTPRSYQGESFDALTLLGNRTRNRTG